jgi:Tol biopolymer transport system component
VSNHWLPFDERRLYRLLGVRRGAIWNQLRDDRRSIAQLARRRGWSASRLALALVAPWRGRVTGSRARLLRTRAFRVITQGHLAQHILFHSLHQFAVPNRSARIFGVERDEYLRLRRSELSPVQIGMLYGRSPAQVQAAVIATLRERARAGVRTRSTPPHQARLLVGRQLSQVPRWLQQARYNGPPKTHHHGPKRGQLVEKPVNYASNPAIAADGSAVAYESYEQRLPLAVQLGEINVFSRALRSGLGTMVSRPVPGHPRSAYNASTSADGRFVAYEVSAGNLNFAKRYGKIEVELHDTSTGATTAVGPPAQPQGQSRSAFNPSLSEDGRRLAFSAAGAGGFTVVWVRDTDTGATTLATPRPPNAPPGDAYGGRISGDGGSVVFAWVPRDGSRSVVHLRDLGSGTTRRVSPAGGSASHPAVSRDATVVAFSLVPDSRGSSRAGARIYLSDVKTGVTRAVSRARDGFGFEPALSADGRQVAYTAARGGRACVLRYDADGGTEAVNPAACGRGVSFDPSISADGNRVAFTSTRRDLAATRSAGARSIYVRDLATGGTTLVSDGFDANGTP